MPLARMDSRIYDVLVKDVLPHDGWGDVKYVEWLDAVGAMKWVEPDDVEWLKVYGIDFWYWHDRYVEEHFAPPPPPCSSYTDEVSCAAAGCYWYDGACHSTPKPPVLTLSIAADPAECFLGDRVVFSGVLAKNTTPVTGAAVDLLKNSTKVGSVATNGLGRYTIPWTADQIGTHAFHTESVGEAPPPPPPKDVLCIAGFHPWYRHGYLTAPYHESFYGTAGFQRRAGAVGKPCIPSYPPNPYNYAYEYDESTRDLVRHQATLAKNAGVTLAISWRGDPDDPVDLVIEEFEKVGVSYFVMTLFAPWSQARDPKVYGAWNNPHWAKIDGRPLWNGAGRGVSSWSKGERAEIEGITGRPMFYIANAFDAVGAGGVLEDVDMIAEPWGISYPGSKYGIDAPPVSGDDSALDRVDRICRHWSSLGRPFAAVFQAAFWHGLVLNRDGRSDFIRRQYEILAKYDQHLKWGLKRAEWWYSWNEWYETTGIEPCDEFGTRLYDEVRRHTV